MMLVMQARNATTTQAKIAAPRQSDPWGCGFVAIVKSGCGPTRKKKGGRPDDVNMGHGRLPRRVREAASGVLGPYGYTIDG
tara:strand:- start:373 stop:615 length:243 start_codon:yes stop_codon:yes gene_type:complete